MLLGVLVDEIIVVLLESLVDLSLDGGVCFLTDLVYLGLEFLLGLSAGSFGFTSEVVDFVLVWLPELMLPSLDQMGSSLLVLGVCPVVDGLTGLVNPLDDGSMFPNVVLMRSCGRNLLIILNQIGRLLFIIGKLVQILCIIRDRNCI